VADNNDSKFIENINWRHVDPITVTVNKYKDEGITVTPVYNAQYDCYAIVDQNNKVKKPFGYEPVDLVPFIPVTLFGVPTNAAT